MTAADRLSDAKRYLAARHLSSDWGAVLARASNPHSAVLTRWAALRGTPSKPAVRAAAPRRRVSNARQFSAGASGPYTSGWNVADQHVNVSLFQNLRQLRARANALARNSEYGGAFLRMVRTNVVGPFGFQLQVQVEKPRGGIDVKEGQKIEDAFATWARPGVCDYIGELSWRDFQNLWINTVARDGEVLVRRYRGAGPFGYQLRLYDPALLDIQHVENLRDGNRIRMGIEFDSTGRRVAYWLTGTNRADPNLGGYIASGQRVRVPADEMWHDFVPLWIDQIRGIPWMCNGMVRQHRLEEFELAAIAAAEEGAKKIAWITTPDGTARQLADGVVSNRQTDATSGGAPTTDDDVPEGYPDPLAGTLVTDSGDGIHYATLPPGFSVHEHSPNYPDEAVAVMVKTSLQGLAAAWGVPYHSLSGNMEGVNYSSARIAELEARDLWKSLQEWMIERLCARVYAEWLPLAILSGRLSLSMDRLPRYDVALWQGRRWDWVDPQNEMAAAEKKLDLGITSRRRVQRDLGLDPEDIRKERDTDALLDAESVAAAAPADPTPPTDGNAP